MFTFVILIFIWDFVVISMGLFISVTIEASVIEVVGVEIVLFSSVAVVIGSAAVIVVITVVIAVVVVVTVVVFTVIIAVIVETTVVGADGRLSRLVDRLSQDGQDRYHVPGIGDQNKRQYSSNKARIICNVFDSDNPASPGVRGTT